ncbi:hypothetical protein A3A79_03620 [Candidatus Gottesmanbacteria bacterium RIFCSPLOWO2_01_FULL_43_11b]|uniref:Glycosyltransferase 2-like domain-containing protein n=1 Tax=Candidatus Gottesmanbacteria bacterium RIFCSPLOWO2_01_FULL_43_11b TaxID=1798392 RepID=A0A1F6AHN8_9BACT|nr:MAG: hypothetical protein A3A79_03620 [Candidatus Gottesmanbacteria bacterium RIFCSPLOWO2_01_FULL_43_11b]
MTISVVIPAYNEEKYLPQTLASLKKLSRTPDEIIVVNASSTDATKDVALRSGTKVITVKKSTIGYSRQVGLKAAKSEVIVFTDADVNIPSDWLTRMETYIQKPGVVGVFGGFRVPDGPWWYKIYINILQPVLNMVYFSILRIPMATGQNMAFYKEKALSVGGFPEEFRIAEDIEIARRLMRIGKIIFRQDFYVWASGRRGHEGFGRLIQRIFKAFFYYFVFRKADKVGFPDVR